MKKKGSEPAGTPGYSYGQPNYAQQNGYPAGAGGQGAGYPPQAGAAGFGYPPQTGAQGAYAAPGYNSYSAAQTGGYSPMPPAQTTGGYGSVPPTPAAAGYGQTAQGTAGGYGAVPPTPAAAGYTPAPPASAFAQTGQPQAGGYAQAPVTGGFSTVPPASASGYGFTPQPPQAATGSFIPQTPYSPGYTSPGFQPTIPQQAGYQQTGYPGYPQQPGGYPQGYSAYAQMGKEPQGSRSGQTMAQMPLNGGGYVPQQVKVRKRPMERSDMFLLIAGCVLALLFLISLLAFPNSALLKWLFLIPAAGMTVLLWMRPVTEENKRLCWTIVAGALCIATIIGLVTMKPPAVNAAGDSTGRSQTGTSASGAGAGQLEPAGENRESTGGGYGSSNYDQGSAAAATPEPTANTNAVAGNRLLEFFRYWGDNDLDNMVPLCAPSWQVKQENAKKKLFSMLQNRRPTEFMLDNISGPQGGDSLIFIMRVSIDKNNGKPVAVYQMSVRMVNESGMWYVDPNSLISNEVQETPDPNATPVITPTPTPYVDNNTVLYYNPDGGKLYHSDANCVSLHSRYLPLKGKFTYGQLNDPQYANLEPCNVCGAPLRK